MSFLTELANVATGGLGQVVMDGIKAYFPPNMSEEQKANIQLTLQNIELQRAAQFSAAQHVAEEDMNARIAMYEGSAADLKAVPYLGALMLLLRGAQRPVWGFVAIYFDYGVFSGMWKLEDQMVSNAFWVVNFLVLGFLFGERAIMNVMPFITQMIQAKQGQQVTPVLTK